MADPTISSAMLDGVPMGGVRAPAYAQGMPPQQALDSVSIKVGDLFPNMKQFRAKLGLYGITHKCPYRARRSDNSRFVGICPTVMNELKKEDHAHGAGLGGEQGKARAAGKPSCPFNVIARRRKEGGVCVTRAMLAHSPDCTAPVTFSTSATSAYMAQLMDDQASNIAPREIGKYVHEATGTKLSYSTLWRTSHLLATKERERQDATFKKIVPFLNAFREANPGTLAVIEQRPDARFYRAFLCPGALANAFGECPFILHVESTPITSFHGGFLLIAYVKDGLGALVPLAMGITPQEDEENWRFFFHQLLTALPIIGCPGVTVTHAKDAAINDAQLSVLPASRSSTNVMRLDWTASGTLHEYYSQLSQLCSNSYFAIMVGWITQVAVLIYARYVELETEHSVFPGGILGRMHVGSSGWEVASFGPSDYLVVNAHEKQQVNLALRTCSCGQWLEQPFPCIHAIRCLPLERLVGLGQFIHPSHFTESVRRCYSRRMALIDANAVPPQDDQGFDQAAVGREAMMIPTEMPLLPPSSGKPEKRGRGRPRVVRPNNGGRGSGLGAMYQCGHCHGKGHNSRTCPLNNKNEQPPVPAPETMPTTAQPPAAMFGDAPVPFAIDAALTHPAAV